MRALLKFNGLLAHSWALSWCLYRLHGIRLIGSPREEIWYFAYGANMHDSTFRQWRGMCPREWRPGGSGDTGCVLTSRCLPGAEPSMLICPPILPRRSGVSSTGSHAATSFGWAPRKAFRGGGIGRFSLDAQDLSGTTLPAMAYIAQGDEDDCKPSLRYLTLLREGARAHGLPEDYILFLEQIEHAR